MTNEQPAPPNPFSPPIAAGARPDPDDAAIYRRYRVLGVVCCYGLWGLDAAFNVVNFELGHLLAIVGAAWAANLACVTDSCVVGRYWPRAFHFYSFWAWPLAMPGYLIWSRKKAALWPIVLHFVALVLLPIAGATVMSQLLG